MIRQSHFGTLPDGQPVERYTLDNETGLSVSLLTYGGILQALEAPDRWGQPSPVVLGYDRLEDYMANPAYVGAVIGPAAGRLGAAALVMGQERYPLPANNGTNTLHGGPEGFHRRLMAAETFETPESLAVMLRFSSPHGTSGYPGALEVVLEYVLQRRENRLQLNLSAVSDRRTYLNLTHHGYFNLSGDSCPVTDHRLQLAAEAFAPVDGAMLPCAGWASVAGTPFDLREPRLLEAVLADPHSQLTQAGGIDHPFRLTPGAAAGAEPCARLHHPASGRQLTVSTDQPHLVVYSGNFLQEAAVPSGKTFGRHQGICFEAQEVPNAPGSPYFPCRYLEAGERYRRFLRYDFSTVSP